MTRIITLGFEQRLFDVATAVAVVLAVAVLLTRFVWQPAQRLAVIQWSFAGGLILAVSLVSPWHVVSLGLGDLSRISPAETSASVSQFSPARLPGLPDLQPGKLAQEAPVAKSAPSTSDLNKKPHSDNVVGVEKTVIQPSKALQSAIVEDPHRWLRWTAIVYCAGACCMTLWLAIGQWTVYGLVRGAVPATTELASLWRELLADVPTKGQPSRGENARLLVSHDVSLPVAVGVFWPAVVLPSWLSETLTPNELRPILAHELAHVRRQDAALRWLAAVFQIVFYYQPCYWWLRRELRLCQEFLADADATACAPSAADYAGQLVALLKAAPVKPWRPSPAIGILERRSELYCRIQMLVASPQSVKLNSGRRWNVTAGILFVAFSLSLGLMTLRAADPAPPAMPPETPQAVVSPQPVIAPASDQGFPFQIVDTKGKPVVGAQVTLWGLSIKSRGYLTLPQKDLPQTISKTDSTGTAKVLLPTGTNEVTKEGLLKLIGAKPERLSLKIDHPGHPLWYGDVTLAEKAPIVLSDSTTIEVRARRSNEQRPAQRLYPAIGQAVDWSEANGVVTMRRVDLTSPRAVFGLRIVQVPEAGPVWFSDLIDLRWKTGTPIRIETELKPGVRVAGRLSDKVPRPIKNGRVVASIVAGRGTTAHWRWESTAEIAADGTFEIESLPADENLEVIASCDGWVSSNPTAAELTDYGRRYGLRDLKAEGSETTTVFPQLWRLAGAVVELDLPMQPTATCEVTVLDEFGKGIPEAIVSFNPNQIIYGSGSTGFSTMGTDRLTTIRAELLTGIRKIWLSDFGSLESVYRVKTDDRGIAVVSNLPAGRVSDSLAPQRHMFFVWHTGYEVTANSPDPEYDVIGTPSFAQLSAGQTTKMAVSMHKTATDEAALSDVAENEFAGRIVDQQGQPLEDVQVLVWERDADKIRSDKNGVFRQPVAASDGDERHLLVRFKKPGYAPHLVVDWSLGTKNRVVVLEKKTYFEGTVRRPDGTPAVDVLIRANQGPKVDNPQAVIENVWTETRTDAAGHYKLLVQPDAYAIEIRAPGVGSARVPKSGEKGDVVAESNLLPPPPKIVILPNEAKQLDIQLVAGVDFQARIVDGITGQPVPDVRLWHWQHPGVEGKSDPQGVVSISTMPEGEFTFMLDPPAGYVRGWSAEIPERYKKVYQESNKDPAAPVSINVTDGIPFDLKTGMPRVTITLEPGVTISGRVLDPNGQPVSGATVAPARSGRGTSLTGDTRFSVATAADGSFTVVLPPSGDRKYNLMVHDGKYQEWRTWANGVGPVLQTKPGQKFDNVELRLSKSGSIRGRTVDEQGQPLANVSVQITALDRLENNYYNPKVRSDKNGNFELSLIRPGRHLVHGWMQVRDTESELKKFPAVDVKQGEKLEIGDLYIPPAYRDRD